MYLLSFLFLVVCFIFTFVFYCYTAEHYWDLS
uniref:Uncharacterized protein n=1 Tax=Anguilla anguilla TaxID=7936 RepID=A0A0E9TPH6_ANGAN